MKKITHIIKYKVAIYALLIVSLASCSGEKKKDNSDSSENTETSRVMNREDSIKRYQKRLEIDKNTVLQQELYTDLDGDGRPDYVASFILKTNGSDDRLCLAYEISSAEAPWVITSIVPMKNDTLASPFQYDIESIAKVVDKDEHSFEVVFKRNLGEYQKKISPQDDDSYKRTITFSLNNNSKEFQIETVKDNDGEINLREMCDEAITFANWHKWYKHTFLVKSTHTQMEEFVFVNGTYELIQALNRDNKTIVLTNSDYPYNVSSYFESEEYYEEEGGDSTYTPDYDADANYVSTSSGLEIKNLDNLCIIGAQRSDIVSNVSNDNILKFTNCSNIAIHNLHIYHEDRENGCQGDVLSLKDCKDVCISDCFLNGSGAIGLDCEKSKNVNMYNSRIFENSEYAIYLGTNSINLNVYNTSIDNNMHHSLIYVEQSSTANLYKCRIKDNEIYYLATVDVRSATNSSNETHQNVTSSKITFTDCVENNNFQPSNDGTKVKSEYCITGLDLQPSSIIIKDDMNKGFLQISKNLD